MMQGYTPQPQPQQPGQWPQQPPQQYQQYPPQQQQYQQQQYYQQQPGMQQQQMQPQPPMQQPGKPKKNMMLIAIIAIVVVVVIVIVAVLLMSGMGTSVNQSTADGAARAFYDATNRYSAKDMLELTSYHFASSLYRGTMWGSLNTTAYAYDAVNAKLTVESVTVTNQLQMSTSDQADAEAKIDGLIYIGITDTVTDYATVTVSYSYSIMGYGIPLTETADALMLKIQGKWYAENPWDLMY